VTVEFDPQQFHACVHRVEACSDFDDNSFPQEASMGEEGENDGGQEDADD